MKEEIFINIPTVNSASNDEIISEMEEVLSYKKEDTKRERIKVDKKEIELLKRSNKKIVKAKQVFGIRDKEKEEIKGEIEEGKSNITRLENISAELEYNIDFEKLLDNINTFLSRFKCPSDLDIKYNPYIELRKMNYDPIEDERKYINFLDNFGIFSNNNGYPKEIFEFIKTFRENFSAVREMYKNIKSYITKIEREIDDSRITPERNITAEETKRNIIKINRDTEKYQGNSWDLEAMSLLSVEEMIEHINRNGSGRYFLHSFPEISTKNGYITTSTGAGDEYVNVRGDSSCRINFTCERVFRDADDTRGFYGTIGEGGCGGVFYPAEIILENYPFINLPYEEGSTWTSSEWRSYATPHDSKSSLHKIPLKAGICFFDEGERDVVMSSIEKLSDDMKPNKIIWYNTDNNEHQDIALTKFIRKLKSYEGLPKLTKIIKPIDTVGGITFFGNDDVEKKWSSDRSSVSTS